MPSENHWYRVVAPRNLDVLVGVAESNVWIGRSMVLEDILEAVTAVRGDEVHDLVGGAFFVRAGESFPIRTRRSRAFEVMLHPGPRPPELTLEGLEEIPQSQSHRPASYRDPEIPIGARRTVPAPPRGRKTR